MESEVSGWVPSRSTSYPKLGGCFMRHSMGVKCSRRRLHTETRIYMLKWSNPCECTVRVIEVVEQRRLGLERAGEGWGEVGCEYGSMGGRGEILRDRTRLRGVGGSGGGGAVQVVEGVRRARLGLRAGGLGGVGKGDKRFVVGGHWGGQGRSGEIRGPVGVGGLDFQPECYLKWKRESFKSPFFVTVV